MPVIARASSVRPEPSSPATPSTSPSIMSTSASSMPDADGHAASAEVRARCAPSATCSRGRARSDCGAAAEHRLDQVDAQQLRRQVLADELAVAQHRDAVADLVDLVEEVRDEQDRHAALLEVADDAEQLGALVEVEARGRLVEHQHPDVGRDRPRDRDQLLDRQGVACRGARRGRCRARGRRAPRAARARIARPVDHPEPTRLAAERDVLGHRDVRQQVDLLVDRADARAAGPRAASRSARPIAVEPELARGQRERPGDRLDQRRLAGAVLAHERVDLAGEEPEVDGVERGVGAEAHRRPGELEERPRVHRAILADRTRRAYRRRSERTTITRCTTMNSSSSSPMMIRVHDCSAPRNEMIVLMVP